ncbi:hypothetical protein Taro_015948 [Colocasia esculenta]|uniref:Uncharacterized protein n=1 Tax=Colocasia esculenta TaxID=4460 RepID=A0A843UMI9_COLES|nr:hypothetical protein [Colocasia esculenta]
MKDPRYLATSSSSLLLEIPPTFSNKEQSRVGYGGLMMGRVEELLVAEELWNDHKKLFFFPFSSAATCTNHSLEVDQRHCRWTTCGPQRGIDEGWSDRDHQAHEGAEWKLHAEGCRWKNVIRSVPFGAGRLRGGCGSFLPLRARPAVVEDVSSFDYPDKKEDKEKNSGLAK